MWNPRWAPSLLPSLWTTNRTKGRNRVPTCCWTLSLLQHFSFRNICICFHGATLLNLTFRYKLHLLASDGKWEDYTTVSVNVVNKNDEAPVFTVNEYYGSVTEELDGSPVFVLQVQCDCFCLVLHEYVQRSS